MQITYRYFKIRTLPQGWYILVDGCADGTSICEYLHIYKHEFIKIMIQCGGKREGEFKDKFYYYFEEEKQVMAASSMLSLLRRYDYGT